MDEYTSLNEDLESIRCLKVSIASISCGSFDRGSEREDIWCNFGVPFARALIVWLREEQLAACSGSIGSIEVS